MPSPCVWLPPFMQLDTPHNGAGSAVHPSNNYFAVCYHHLTLNGAFILFLFCCGQGIRFWTIDPRVHPYPLNQLLFKPGKKKNEGKNGHLEWFYSIITFPGVLGVDSPYPLGPLVFSLKRTSLSVLMQWASSIRCAGLKYSALVLNISSIFK